MTDSLLEEDISEEGPPFLGGGILEASGEGPLLWALGRGLSTHDPGDLECGYSWTGRGGRLEALHHPESHLRVADTAPGEE